VGSPFELSLVADVYCEGVIDHQERERFRRGVAEALASRPRRVEFHLCGVTAALQATDAFLIDDREHACGEPLTSGH
jgi:hypothetical protein